MYGASCRLDYPSDNASVSQTELHIAEVGIGKVCSAVQLSVCIVVHIVVRSWFAVENWFVCSSSNSNRVFRRDHITLKWVVVAPFGKLF